MRSLVRPAVICIVASLTFGLSRSPARTGDKNTKRAEVRIPASYTAPLNRAQVLFIEDRNAAWAGPLTRPDPVWILLLDDLVGPGNYGWYGPIETAGEDGPELDTMLQYELVIWNTYDYWWNDTAALTVNDQNNLAVFLQTGGNVWLIGQDLIYSGVPLSFLDDNFHLDGYVEDYSWEDPSIDVQGLAEIQGFEFNNTTDYENNNFFPDELIPDISAHGIFEDTDSNRVIGILYDGTDWKSAFWALDIRSASPNDSAVEIVRGMLEIFGVTGIYESKVWLPRPALRMTITPNVIQGSAVIEINLIKAGELQVEIFDITGKLMETLCSSFYPAGTHPLSWNTRNDYFILPAGIYFVLAKSDKTSAFAKIIVVK